MRYASLIVLAAAIGACSRPVKPNPESPQVAVSVTDSKTGEAVSEGASGANTQEPAASIAEASNAFAFDLYSKIRQQKGNLAFSPASIMAALAMTQGGAEGETRAEMAKVLHLDPNRRDASFEVGELFGALGKESPGLTLRMANRLFGERSFTFEKSFLQKTQAAFGAPLEALDFRHGAEASRVVINDWVAKETERKIEDLVPRGGVAEDTRLVLVNAVYFLGKWATPFEKSSTWPRPFHLEGGSTKEVPMMHATGHRLYGEAEGVKLLELGYRESEFAMTFVLPHADRELADIESKLSPEQLSAWVSALGGHRTEVSLPKFRIEPGEALALGRPLGELGMKLAFDGARADFTAMANPKNTEERLSIADVFHKAFVAVDEEGTEAAAATAVVMRATSAAMPEQVQVKEFRADRPFLFLLRHKPSGTVLFAGRVVDPA